jgi:hypothetical protein
MKTRGIMEKTGFENLRVHRLAEDIADLIWEIVIKWDWLPQDTVGKQLIKSADSVGGNIAAGTGWEVLRTISDLPESQGAPYSN